MAAQKIALVTGAGSGVGKAAALALSRDGFTVVLAGRRADKLARSGEGAGRRQRWSCRPTCASRPRSRLCSPRSRKPSAGSIFCSTMPASACAACRIEDIPLERWQSVVATNLTGLFLCTQEAIKIMKAQDPRGGRIINNGSISAHTPRPGHGALHRDQTRDHRPDQTDLARLPRLRHLLRPDRHRQRRDPAHRKDGDRHAAGGRPRHAGSAHECRRCRPRRRLHGEPAARRQCAVHDRDGEQDAVRRAGLKHDPMPRAASRGATATKQSGSPGKPLWIAPPSLPSGRPLRAGPVGPQ